jgi:nucleotide-binding universal stress UspA family protein
MKEGEVGEERPIRVLAAVDGSEHAERAAQVAAGLLAGRRLEVGLLVVLSFELDPYTLLGESLEDTPERQRAESHAVESATSAPKGIFEAVGARVEVRHRFGNPADEILAEAHKREPDLIVVGRQGLSAPARWLIGSVSDRVVRHAHAPVLVVP